MIDEKKLIEDILQHENVLASANHVYKSGYRDRQVEIIDIINRQPKVGEWIPVSEKLPEESGTYIVNAIENCIVHVTFAKWMKRMKKWNLTGSRSYWKVTAWQPLPEPWKGEVNE